MAAAQANVAPHRSRHACSARLPIKGTSCLARVWANWLKKARICSDHRPPTSRPTPPILLSCGDPPTPGTWRSSPSCSALCLGLPSSCKAHTNVVSTASCAPPRNGRLSTSNDKSISLRNMLVRTRPLSKAKPRRPSIPPPVRKLQTATSAVAHGQRERLAETAQENPHETNGEESLSPSWWAPLSCSTCSWSRMRPNQSLLQDPAKQLDLEMLFHT